MDLQLALDFLQADILKISPFLMRRVCMQKKWKRKIKRQDMNKKAKVMMRCLISLELHRLVKIRCAEDVVRVQDFIACAIIEKLGKKSKKC